MEVLVHLPHGHPPHSRVSSSSSASSFRSAASSSSLSAPGHSALRPPTSKSTTAPSSVASSADDYFSADPKQAGQSGAFAASVSAALPSPDSFHRALDAIDQPFAPLASTSKGVALLPTLDTTPATPGTSPSKVTFSFSPTPPDEDDHETGFVNAPTGLDRSTSVQLLASPKSSLAALDTTRTLRKRCKSLPLIPPESDICPADLVRQFSEAALDETFGSALRLTAHRMALKMEQRYRALLELVETERDYVSDLKIFIDVYLNNLEMLPSLSDEDRSVVRRNTEAIYHFHQFISSSFESIEADVRWQVSEGAGAVADDSRVLKALTRIAEVLLSQADDFSVYNYFCARHTEAATILRRAEEHQLDFDCYMAHCLMSLDRLELPYNKLDIQDYAIKPVQRICRYPLMLAQLANLVSEEQQTEATAARAIRAAYDAIRNAAGRVDAAKQAFACETRSTLIATRLELPQATQPAFLGVLGSATLVGALFYVEPAGPDQHVKVKYYGAFLYRSHILLVKVKRQDAYEPRHWLPLRVFEVESVLEEDSILPFSFRLKHQQHVFELAATNAAEKALWCDRLNAVILQRRKSWLSEVLENPVRPPFDDLDISSIPIDAPMHDLEPTSPADENLPTLPGALHTFPKRSRLAQTASNFLGRTPSSTRAIVDLRLADVMSEECSTIRILAERDASNARGTKFMSIRARPETRRPASVHGSLSRNGTVRDSLRRRSFINEKPGLANFHRRRSSADVAMATPEALELAPRHAQAPSLSRSRTGPVPRVQRSESPEKGWASIRRRTMSFKSFSGHDTAILGDRDATVGRNGSSSSASSGMVASPGSSAPSSPLMTPRDLAPAGFGGIFRSLSRRKSQGGMDAFLPSLGSPEQNELALEANDFLYGQSKRWRPKWGSSSSLASHSRQSSSNSLFGFFLPGSTECTVPEDAPVLTEEPTSADNAENKSPSASSTYLVLPSSDKRKRKLFRNLTRMTSLSSVTNQ